MFTTPTTPADVPPPPRDVPRWFFVRRMQALVFIAVFMTALGFAMLGAVSVWSRHLPPGPDVGLDGHHRTARGRITRARYLANYHYGRRSPIEIRFTFQTPHAGLIAATGYTLDQSYRDARPGEEIEVEYDPAEPTVARPVGGFHGLFPAWAYLLLGWPVLVGIGLMFPLVLAVHREQALLTHGHVAEAEVADVGEVWYIHFGRRHPFDVAYAFRDVNGRDATGCDRTYQYDWAESLQVGDRVFVIYDPITPQRNALWITQPVQPADAPGGTGE